MALLHFLPKICNSLITYPLFRWDTPFLFPPNIDNLLSMVYNNHTAGRSIRAKSHPVQPVRLSGPPPIPYERGCGAPVSFLLPL